MIKVIIVIIALFFGFATGRSFSELGIGFQLLISTGFSLLYLVAEAVLFFAIAGVLVLPVNKRVDAEKQSVFYRKLMCFYSKFLFNLFGMKIVYKGKEKLGGIKQFVLIANHRSNLDSMILDVYLKDYPLIFCAKKSLFNVPFIGRVIHACAYIKLDRKNLSLDHQRMEQGVDLAIEKGYSIGVFPEGKRSYDYNVQKFHEGSFLMCYEMKCPIVISALRNTHEVNNNLLFKKHIVYCDIVEVIKYEDYKDLSETEIALQCEEKVRNFLKENKI